MTLFINHTLYVGFFSSSQYGTGVLQFIGLRKVLEALVNLGNSEFYLLVKLGDNPSPNGIGFVQNYIRILRSDCDIVYIQIGKILFPN
jgi:nicotinic acid phosphoribosyltransferase